eukprot:scaffold117158_cov32-Tisochrysis_lutea.AAC.4
MQRSCLVPICDVRICPAAKQGAHNIGMPLTASIVQCRLPPAILDVHKGARVEKLADVLHTARIGSLYQQSARGSRVGASR